MSNRRTFSKDYKIAAIHLARERGSSTKAAQELGIANQLISRWKREFSSKGETSFSGNGNAILTDQEKLIRDLQKQVKDLELDRKILKEAMGIFSEKRHRSSNS